jgi:hypothetical protein
LADGHRALVRSHATDHACPAVVPMMEVGTALSSGVTKLPPRRAAAHTQARYSRASTLAAQPCDETRPAPPDRRRQSLNAIYGQLPA